MNTLLQSVRLDRPVRLADQKWLEGTAPVVSVLCATYNHEPYIRECLEGFLMQETTFPVEIIVRDDASTDCTAGILVEFEHRHPSVFRMIYEKKNQFSQGVRPTTAMMSLSRGDYIALCEGDDYWITADKLQKQVEILESRASVSLVFTDRDVIGTEGYKFEEYPELIYTTRDVWAGFTAFTQTMMFRNYRDLVGFLVNHDEINGDDLITYYCSLLGEIHRIPEKTATYRQTGSGIWSSNSKAERLKVSLYKERCFYETFGPSGSLRLSSATATHTARLLDLEKNPKERRRIYGSYVESTGGRRFALLRAYLVIKMFKFGSVAIRGMRSLFGFMSPVRKK